MIIDPNGEALRPTTRVLVAVAAGETIPTAGAHSLASLMAHTAARRPDVELLLYMDRDPIQANARQGAADAAVQHGMTHVLFLDPRAIVPRDALSRLLDHRVDGLVAAAFVANEIPTFPLASRHDGEPLYVEPTDITFMPAEHVSLHCALVTTAVLADLPRPAFRNGWDPRAGRFVPEELYFVSQVREHGHPVLVDLDLSQRVTHLGEMEYRSVHALQSRDLAAPDEAPVGVDH